MDGPRILRQTQHLWFDVYLLMKEWHGGDDRLGNLSIASHFSCKINSAHIGLINLCYFIYEKCYSQQFKIYKKYSYILKRK